MKDKTIGGYARKWITAISDLPADELKFLVGAAIKKLMSLGCVTEKHAARLLKELDSAKEDN